jgi:uncharacterized protein with FMN-binding domain
MLISIILAWIATVSAAMAALKFIARVSGSKKLNRFFHNIHIPFGVILLISGLLHGILAGNMAGTEIADIQLAPVLFTLNWGTACYVAALLLALTYAFRKSLKKAWMPLHRILTAALIALLVLHMCNMGIQLFDRLSGSDTQTAQTEYAAETSDASTGTNSAASADTSSDASGTTSGTSSDASGSGTTQSSSVVEFSGAVLNDGTYEGSADGYSGTTTVSVTVSGGQVTAIDVVSESDSQQFFSRAESVLDDIINGQTLEVDTVSGATFSSAGLINAVYDALDGAVQSGTLNVTSIDLSNVQRHG